MDFTQTPSDVVSYDLVTGLLLFLLLQLNLSSSHLIYPLENFSNISWSLLWSDRQTLLLGSFCSAWWWSLHQAPLLVLRFLKLIYPLHCCLELSFLKWRFKEHSSIFWPLSLTSIRRCVWTYFCLKTDLFFENKLCLLSEESWMLVPEIMVVPFALIRLWNRIRILDCLQMFRTDLISK